MTSKLTSLLAAALSLLAASDAVAQQRNQGSSFGASSLFGSSGQSASGQTGFGQSGFGQSAFGQSAFGQSGGLSAFGGGQNQNGFVGRDGNDTANFFEQLGRGSQQFLQRVERSFGRGANRGRDAQPTQERRPSVRVQLRLGFAPPQASTQVAGESLAKIAGAFARKSYGDASVRIENGVAVLSGAVPTQADRRLAERIVMLEPGVSRVENKLTIGNATIEIIPPAPNS